jgi:hypothetical protein
MRRPVIDIAEVLAWADAFHHRFGRWPTRRDGRITGQLGLTWNAVDLALQKGGRGLRRGSSLAKLLLKQRGKRHKGLLPKFTTAKILAWADAHHRRTGAWPTGADGAIRDAPGETWQAVDKALRDGRRGQPGGSSLARLLSQKRGVRNPQALPKLTTKQVLAWADAHHARTATWPTRDSGPIREAPLDTWKTVNTALIQGLRGLPPSGSLAQLLARHRGVRNRKNLPKLFVRTILPWADAHHARTGRWPTHISGPIPEAPGETWAGVHAALYHGNRGFPGNSSLYLLLQRHGRRQSRIQARRRRS